MFSILFSPIFESPPASHARQAKMQQPKTEFFSNKQMEEPRHSEFLNS